MEDFKLESFALIDEVKIELVEGYREVVRFEVPIRVSVLLDVVGLQVGQRCRPTRCKSLPIFNLNLQSKGHALQTTWTCLTSVSDQKENCQLCDVSQTQPLRP